MFDESIGSSPQKRNRSIHKARLLRKSQRRKLGETMQTSLVDDSTHSLPQLEEQKQSVQCDGSTLRRLHDLYDTATFDELDDTLCRPLPQIQRYDMTAGFDPFEEERILMLADRVQQPNRRKVKLSPTQSFQPCNLGFSESNAEVPLSNDTIVAKSNIAESAKTQFGITESELLHLCDETEKRVVAKGARKSASNTQLQTPQANRSKSIVEMILEDFNSSPASPEAHFSEESPFIFKFANEPLRTYSRREGREHVVARQNIASQLESVAVDDIEDDLLSIGSSSGLSVQEGITQEPSEAAKNDKLHNSQILCENLQNLSTYFNQLTEREEEQLEPVEGDTMKEHSDVTQLYVTAREEQESADEFLKDVKLQDIDKHQVIDANGVIIERSVRLSSVIHDIMTWRENHPVVFNPNSSPSTTGFCGFSTDKKISTKNQIHIEDEQSPTSKLFLPKRNDAIASPTNKYDIQTKTEHTREMKELDDINIFMEDTNEWNDECDFFANFSSQDLLKKGKLNEKESCEEDCESKESTAVPIINTTQKEANATESQFLGFRTASKKSIQISKEAQMRAANILQEVSGLEILEAQEKNSTITATEIEIVTSRHKNNSHEHLENTAFIGFRTASSKVIQISKEAQIRAAKILEQLPDFPTVKCTSELDKILPTRKFNAPTPNLFHKLIDSNSANEENLADIQFSEWCLEDVEAMKNDASSKEKTEDKQQATSFPGFATASKKCIKISEAAKIRAASILAELPELSKVGITKQADSVEHNYEKNITNGTTASLCDELGDFVFSEWPLSEDVCEVKKVEENHLIDAVGKRKFDYANSNSSDVAVPSHAAKMLRKSDSMSKIITTNRTPLNNIENGTICSSLSDMAVQTPLNSHTSRTVISRKNLLSLSRRNKSIRRMSYDDCHGGETPIKRSVNAAVAGEQCRLPQTPPDTPMPNLKEFFDSVAQNTSTPHPTESKIRARLRKCALPKAEQPAATASTEFKPIEWEPENDNIHNNSNSSVKTPDRNISRHSNDDNIIQMDTNPTAKQRIERLKMYGRPPNVSPIYMSNKNNCRPSGLRRRDKSLVKQ